MTRRMANRAREAVSRNLMSHRVGLVLALIALGGGAWLALPEVAVHAAKPAPSPTALGPWPAVVTFRSGSTDGIRSDGRKVTATTTDWWNTVSPVDYVNGIGGVSATIFPPPQYNPTSAHAGSFYLQFSSPGKNQPWRSLFYPAQIQSLDEYPGWGDYYGGKLVVWHLSEMLKGDTKDLVAISLADFKTQFQADGVPAGEFSRNFARVSRSLDDGCTWTISFNPDAAHMVRWQGVNLDQYSGVFSMPFEAVIHAKPDTKAGLETTPTTCNGSEYEPPPPPQA